MTFPDQSRERPAVVTIGLFHYWISLRPRLGPLWPVLLINWVSWFPQRLPRSKPTGIESPPPCSVTGGELLHTTAQRPSGPHDLTNLRSVPEDNGGRHLSRLSEKRIRGSGQGDTYSPDTNFFSSFIGSVNIDLVGADGWVLVGEASRTRGQSPMLTLSSLIS